ASNALQGRMSLQPGDDVAIQWIASEFAKAGLQPAADGSYLQPVELVEYRGDRAQSFVSLRRSGNEKQWKYPDILGAYRAAVKVLNAQAHGAVGVLIVAEPNRKHPSNQERIARIGGSATRAVPLPSQALANDELHIPAAVISDAAAKEFLANAAAPAAELQSA